MLCTEQAWGAPKVAKQIFSNQHRRGRWFARIAAYRRTPWVLCQILQPPVVWFPGGPMPNACRVRKSLRSLR